MGKSNAEKVNRRYMRMRTIHTLTRGYALRTVSVGNRSASNRSASNRSATPYTHKKTYIDPHNSAKLTINKQYAESTMKYLGSGASHVILDSKFCVTSKILVDEGFDPAKIYAPNINAAECRALKKFGVHSPHMSIEEFTTAVLPDAALSDVAMSKVTSQGIMTQSVLPKEINSLWYDSMTNIGGNIRENYYPCVVVDHFLKCNMRAGNKCTVAVTLSTRTNQINSIHGTCKDTAIEQIRRLVSMRGFIVASHWNDVYKKNMLYAVWHLVYDPSRVGPTVPLLKWKRNKGSVVDRYIGFP